MAFILDDNSQVISFAEYQDVLNKDQRVFDSNEGLTDSIIDSHLIRATERILSRLRSSNWWIEYYTDRSIQSLTSRADIPALDTNRIIGRENDFTDLCVYVAMSEYILPVIADFGTEDNSERRKMDYYATKSQMLFSELIESGDWYDFNNDTIIDSSEKQPAYVNLRRIR
jgi:hypothetical protein